MGAAKLLDCTLRDGAYLVDKKFGDPAIAGIIDGLMKARVDYIEIGFLQDEGFGDGKTVFKNAADAKRFIPEDKKKCKFSVLADYSRYSISNLEENTGNSIDIVRECFFKQERFEAMKVCQEIKKKGYEVFVQPVDALGYTDAELIELLDLVNQVEPYCFSIVDTFGSMYEEDLQHIYSIVDHNLVSSCKIGFHSHNNMQLSSSLSQAFLRMNGEKRKGIIDGTISGMGRGAGNTPTELIAEYMVRKLGYDYNMDALLDMIDSFMDNIRAKCTWGYSTPYFIAGCYSAHVNNVTYLTQKSSIRSKDIRFILNKIGAAARKRYPYDLLEKTYLGYLQSDIDDSEAMSKLKNVMKGKNVVVIAPGQTATAQCSLIQKYIEENNAVVIMVNFVHDEIMGDFVYMSNVKRYRYWIHTEKFQASHKILTSNIIDENVNDKDTFVVSFAKLVKCGWEHLDNSSIMLLRLLDAFELKQLAIAGLDGYHYFADGKLNYVNQELELSNVKENPMELNQEIQDMLKDFMKSRKQKYNIRFITESRFSSIVE